MDVCDQVACERVSAEATARLKQPLLPKTAKAGHLPGTDVIYKACSIQPDVLNPSKIIRVTVNNPGECFLIRRCLGNVFGNLVELPYITFFRYFTATGPPPGSGCI